MFLTNVHELVIKMNQLTEFYFYFTLIHFNLYYKGNGIPLSTHFFLPIVRSVLD